ncbi:protein FAF-like, chloroplastic [Vicia villosa]|uniref:protein FAF-like, chloroplastic n=1 Tax=Vicia villosa TaxID=3911 RepID=UPI00273CE66D|nr:protein FAF-like, chloroplastic [Vicia villosa]
MSICMSMKIEQDTVLNQKQGIVTILNCNTDTNFTPPSLRRTLSADMSSKKWLSQNGSSNTIKKISSSKNLFGQDDEAKLGDDEDEAERERLQIWSSIQKNKKEEQQKDGSFDTWGSLMSLKTNDEISKSLPPYIHPLAKRTKSSLSRKSLEICTESLGSETGSDGLVFSYPQSSESPGSETRSDGLISSYPPSILTEGIVDQQQQTRKDHEEDKKEMEDEKEEEVVEVERLDYSGVTTTHKKSPPRSFPPPLPSLSRQDGPPLQMRPHRDNGRLVLEAVSLPSLNNFCVQRQGGRLVLTFANQDEEIAENDEVGELEEEFEGFEEEKEDGDEVDEEYESVIGKGSLMSFEKTTIKSSVHWIGSNQNNKVNKTIGLLNKNPKWSKKFNHEVDNNKDVQVVEASQIVKSLPPRPRVARLIPSPPNAATGSFNLNSYQHYWRTTKPTSTKLGNYPLDRYQEKNNNDDNYNNNDSKSNKIVVSAKGEMKNMNMNRVSNEKQQLLVLKGKNGDYLVHNLKNCKDSRRSFLFWEPYCIATS